MNSKLYEKIILEKNSIEKGIIESGKEVNPQSVSEQLKVRLASEKDTLSVLCAFYEYMEEKEFSFIKDEPWSSYFKTSISNSFTEDKINLYTAEIQENEKLQKFLGLCTDSVKESYYKQIQELKDKTTEIKSEKIASIPSKVLGNIKRKLDMFNNKFKIENLGDLKKYSFSAKEVIFDKIAKAPRMVLNDIHKFSIEKKQFFDSFVDLKERNYLINSLNKKTYESKPVVVVGATYVGTKENENSFERRIA